MYSAIRNEVVITVERKYDFTRVSSMRIATADDVDQHCLRLQSCPIGCRSLLHLEYTSGMSANN